MYVLLALLMISVLVMMHEFGHFLAARACGIAVREFSIGMGPLLLKRKGKQGTQFSLRLLPVGGYCMFYGEDDEEDKRPTELDEAHRPFAQERVFKRMITIASGPLMNFLVAFVVVVIYVSVIGLQTVVPRVGELEENARAAGLMVGDEILAVNDQAVTGSQDVTNAINEAAGAEVIFTVLRDGQQLELPMTPFFDEEEQRYRVGFSFSIDRMRMPFLQSIPFSAQYCISSVGAVIDALGDIFTKGEGIDEMTGIVGTVYVIQDATRAGGFDMFIELLAVISVNLGVMNLLPIPGLDGSKLIFLIVEAVRGKPLSPKLESVLTIAGLVLIFGLMIALTYKDLTQILSGTF